MAQRNFIFMIHTENKLVKARKPHNCTTCEAEILKGQHYRIGKFVAIDDITEDDNVFKTFKICAICLKLEAENMEIARMEQQEAEALCEANGGHRIVPYFHYSFDEYGVGNPEYLDGHYCENCGHRAD